MKKSVYNFSGRQIILWGLLFVSILSGAGIFLTYKTRASENNNMTKTFQPERASAAEVIVGERVSPWIKLQPGKPLETTFYGNDEAVAAMRNNRLIPLSQVSTDFNSDGYPDLVSGFRDSAGGGLIALHSADSEAFAPQDPQILADLRNGVFPATFKKDALILNVPTAPDFIFAGRFSQGSAVDLVFASRGGCSIYLMTSDGRGGYNAPREIAIAGEITALASENISSNDAYSGVVAAVVDGETASLLIFSGKTELGGIVPHSIEVGGRVDSLILAKPNVASFSMDLFGLMDGRIFTISNIGKAKSGISQIELPFRTIDFTIGEFIRDRQGKAEIAALSEGGTVSYLTNGTLDTRPFTTAEMIELRRENLNRSNTSANRTKNDFFADWQISEENSLGVFLSGSEKSVNSSRLLQRARITGNETDDLLIINPQGKKIEVLFKEPNRDENRMSFTKETKLQTVNVAGNTAAVLPMRLNVMGQEGFAIFNEGNLEPATVIFAPNTTFNVTTTTDENNGCGAGAGCSVREAVIASNGAAGGDMITFGLNGSHQLTIAGANNNSSTTGDLDVTDAITIVGNGAANTFIQAGTNSTNGIDKVFSINPLFTTPFATSISNLTIRFGRNPSPISGDGYGGGIDWEGSGTGTLSLAGVTIDNNRTNDGFGGGIAAVNTGGGSGSMTMSNSTVSNNTSAAANAAQAVNGGGMWVAFDTRATLTNVVVNANTATGSSSQGGGIFFEPAAALTTILTGMTITGNSSPTSGGGISTGRQLSVVAPTTISSNTSGASGGGLYVNRPNITIGINKATMVGNSAVTTGGAIAMSNTSSGTTLTMTYSRIVGNTGGGFTGLAVASGTATVENNWWGCNTGPSAAPCNTAGATGGSVDFDPWLRYTHTASSSTIAVGQSTTLTVSFLTNSSNQPIAASNLDVLIGLPVTFNTPVRGAISGSPTVLQSTGTATATFTATSPGAGSANAQFDNGTATANITINQATTTTTITSDNPDPSVVGQTITVTYTVVGQFGGTPTGNVTVSDGVNSCTATVAASQCSLALTTAGARTLTATYAGDTNFTGSSDTEPHTVNKANTTTTINSDSPDPSAINQFVTVTYTVAAVSPGTGTPTGNVTVSDGVNSCTGTVAAGQCSVALATAGNRTLTANYVSDANFNVSVSPGVSHTVLPPTAASATIGGRVKDQNGRGIANASVTLTDQDGHSIAARTNSFGYYRFAEVAVGRTYIMAVNHKSHTFTQVIITVNDNLQDINFTATD